MWLIFGWLIIGIAVGWAIASFMEGRGGLPMIWNVIAGAVGGGLSGFLFIQFGQMLVGEGPEMVVSFLAAAVGALIFVLLARLVKK